MARRLYCPLVEVTRGAPSPVVVVAVFEVEVHGCCRVRPERCVSDLDLSSYERVTYALVELEMTVVTRVVFVTGMRVVKVDTRVTGAAVAVAVE